MSTAAGKGRDDYRREIIERIAAGLELPKDLLESESVNHWSFGNPFHAKPLSDVQEFLWSTLRNAYNRCIPRPGWSIEAEAIRDRIIDIARLVGPTPWEKIDVSTLRMGLYQQVLERGGVPYPPIDWERVAKTERAIGIRE